MTLSDGRNIKVHCLSCSIVEGEVEPTGGTIYETKFFHAHQDVAYPIKGLVILASKRHIKCLDVKSVKSLFFSLSPAFSSVNAFKARSYCQSFSTVRNKIREISQEESKVKECFSQSSSRY